MKTTTVPATAGPRHTLTALRAVVTLGTVSVLAQPVLAGGYLGGEFDFLAPHEMNAHAFTGLLLVQAVAALVYATAGRGSWLPLGFTAAQFAAASVQVAMGYDRALAVHIPLGVFLVLLALHVCVWVYRPTARLSRADRKARKDVTHDHVA